ncbi:MAG: response regulator [Pseudomonadota bacterium]
MANILLLEDDMEFAFRLRSWIEAAGHLVDWCASGADAITALETICYDLVIADMYIYEDGQISQDGGISLIAALRMGRFNLKLRTPWDVPILAISGVIRGKGKRYALAVAESLGAERTLKKPFQKEQFLAEISMLSERQPTGLTKRLRHPPEKRHR